MSTVDEKDMNCEEFRQAIAADPAFDGGSSHLRECAACSAYKADMQALDSKIATALALAVPVLRMPDLPEIDSSNVVGLPRRRVAPAWFAVAATVVIAAVVGLRMLAPEVQYESLADQVIAHIDHEPYSLRATNATISEQRLQTVLADNVAEFDRSAGLVTYAQSCEINGNSVPHLVVQGEYGPITILLMPEEQVASAITIEGEFTRGIILPVGSGSIAIVGGRDEQLESIQESVVKSVTWDT